MKLSITLATAVVFAIGVSHLEAGKLKVPKDYATIQAAMAAVQNDDVVLISAGKYVENLVLQSHTNVTIKGIGKVVVRPVAGTGLLVKNCTKITIQGIRFQKAAVYNLHVEGCDDVVIRKCRVKKGQNGFWITNSLGVRVRDNMIQDTSGGGITLSGTKWSLVRGNKVSGTGQYAIHSSGDGNTVEKNTIVDCYKGIIVGQCTNNLVVDNDVESIFDRGITVGSASAITVLDNEVRKAKVGIALGSDSNNTVIGNSVSKTSEHGIQLYSSDYATVSGNKVRKSNYSGISVYADSGLFYKNDVRKSGHAGFAILGKDCVFIENIAKKSGWYDLQENVGSTSMTYIANVYDTSNF